MSLGSQRTCIHAHYTHICPVGFEPESDSKFDLGDIGLNFHIIVNTVKVKSAAAIVINGKYLQVIHTGRRSGFGISSRNQ